MDPVAFSIPMHLGNFGPVEIRWYGIAMALSMLVGAWIAAALLKRIGRNGELVWDGLFWIILAGVLGARFVYVITNLSAYSQNFWDIFAVWKGGLSFHGGIIAGLLVSYWWFAKRGIPFIEVMDAFAPGVSLGVILVRIGNFMNGDILGYKWDGPWAMNFPFDEFHMVDPQAIVMRHPTEIYGMLVGLICFLICMVLWIETYETRRFAPGAAYMGFIFAYSLVRCVIEEPFRDVPLPWLVVDPQVAGYGLFTTTQLASVILILIAFWGFFQLRSWEKARAAAAVGKPLGTTRQQRRASERDRKDVKKK